MEKDPFQGFWAVPGGLVNPSETVENSAKKNLSNILGSDDVYLEQLYTFGEIDRDPSGRVVSVAYIALTPDADSPLGEAGTNQCIDWFPVSTLPTLAYDHGQMIDHAVERLRAKLTYTNIMYWLMPNEFTLSELQKTYETILCKKLDKRNFRKKIMSLNLVTKTKKKTSGKAHRPANLYQFTKTKPEIIPIF